MHNVCIFSTTEVHLQICFTKDNLKKIYMGLLNVEKKSRMKRLLYLRDSKKPTKYA